MNLQNAVDFETFYFYSLLETINKKGLNSLDHSLHDPLKDFLEFLSEGATPLDSIEKLARRQGTSDVSIFFSDLIERINEYDPEKSMQKIDEYAFDFLEMFRELVKDPQWNRTVSGDSGAAVPEEMAEADLTAEREGPQVEEKYKVVEFIHEQLRKQAIDTLNRHHPAADEILNALFNRLQRSLPDLDIPEMYRNDESLTNLLSLFDKLYHPPREFPALQEYLDDFWRESDTLCAEMEILSNEYPEKFEKFCRGEQIIASEPEVISRESNVDEIIESVGEKGKEPGVTAELTEEDKNLRFLLRDYLVNEIGVLTDEIVKEINVLIHNRGNDEAESILLENLKVLKDLGQIHKYPLIENTSTELLNYFRKISKTDQPFPGSLVQPLQQLLNHYSVYIDGVLNENEEESVRFITSMKDSILKTDATEITVEIPVKIQDKSKFQPAFLEVHERWVKRLKTHFSTLLEDISNDSLRQEMIEDIGQLNFWYDVFKISGAQDLLEVFRNWLSNPNKSEKLVSKSQSIFTILDDLVPGLFQTTRDQWTEYLEKLTLSEPVSAGLDINRSDQAFQDVTRRYIGTMTAALEREELGFEKLRDDYLIPSLVQIRDNSKLVKNEGLAQISEYLKENLLSLQSVEEEKLVDLREQLGMVFSELTRSAEQPPQKADFSEVRNTFNLLVSGLSASPEIITEAELQIEEPGLEEEQLGEVVPEEELSSAYRDETRKYLEQLEEYVKLLNQDPEDESALREFSNVIHTAKGSARMMKQTEMVVLAGPIENLAEHLQNRQIQTRKNYVSIFRKAVKAMRKIIDGKKPDTSKIIESINDYIRKYPVEEHPGNDTKKKPEKSRSTRSVKGKKKKKKDKTAQPEEEPEEKQDIEPIETIEPEPIPSEKIAPQEPLLTLKESDPELLEIFRNEAQNNLINIENSLDLIEKFNFDKEILQRVDHAIHEIRSAAKMLGFSEIGSLVDGLEELTELVNRREPDNLNDMLPAFRKGLQLIREVSENKDVSQSAYDDLMTELTRFVGEMKNESFHPSEPEISAAELKDELKKEPSGVMMQSFLQEGREYAEDMNFLLMKLEKDPGNRELLEQLMRTLHTMKGSSSMMFQNELEKILHLGEELVERVTEQSGSLPPEVVDQMFAVVDEVDFILNSLAEKGKPATHHFDKVVEDLQSGVKKYGGESEAVFTETPEEVISPGGGEKGDEYVRVDRTAEAQRKKPLDAHVRLDVKQIDNLLNEAAELVINHNQLKTQVEKFKGYVPKLDLEGKNLQNILWYMDKILKEQEQLLTLIRPGATLPDAIEDSQKTHLETIRNVVENLQKFQTNFAQALQGIKSSGKIYEEQLQKITRLSSAIHDEIIKARLVPIGLLFQRFHRPLRDIAKKHGKKIKLNIEGENTELDRILADELYEPMLHILRNAVDHGIESPGERKKARKPEEGLIRISAEQERNYVIITIEDDGRGINISDIRQQILDKKLLTPEDLEKLTTQELYEFLMIPRFSTAKKKTVLSGRGVGLDVVRNQIQKLKGDLRIYSQPEQNTRFVIRMPYSITVTQAMLVEVDSNLYAIPLLQVEETISISNDNLQLREDGYYTRLRGGEIPVIYMAHLLRIGDEPNKPVSRVSQYSVIIVQDEGKKAALLVDKIMHREEILIKSLGRDLQRVKYIMGGSILADGRVVLVLDIPQIVFSSLRLKEKSLNLHPDDFKSGAMEKATAVPRSGKRTRVVRGRKPLVLIVDDSLSIRKFLSGLLKKQDYEVELAKNGQTAIELLSQREFDAVITDLEMPQLSGYDLIEQIRGDSRWDSLPVIVLTGRASKNIEKQSLKLGADEFVIKPFKESELLEKLGEYIDFKKE
jgi:chemotaxis protein histidine kinase CheA/ActR/RegA family two-component response regulator